LAKKSRRHDKWFVEKVFIEIFGEFVQEFVLVSVKAVSDVL
jgi:hypothetical protein